MFDSMYKVVYFVEFVLISIGRTAHTREYRHLTVAVDRKTLPDMLMLTLGGIGILVPLIYVFSTSLDFASYSLPAWTGWLGTAVFAAANWLLWRPHVNLGMSWTPTIGIRDNHQLVTDGVFKYVRHPMYAAHILWGGAGALMLHN